MGEECFSANVPSENEEGQISCFLLTAGMDPRFTQLYQEFVWS